MAELVSQREYARRRGVTHRAVQKAIESGRIAGAIRNGKIDPVKADKLWGENTDETKPRNSVSGDPKHRRTKPEAAPTPAESRRSTASRPAQASQSAADDDDEPPAPKGPSYIQSRAIREAYLARMAKLDYEERNRKLVNADEVAVAWFRIITEAKTRLLSVPAKAKARIPHLNPEHVAVIDDLIREALEELSQWELPKPN